MGERSGPMVRSVFLSLTVAMLVVATPLFAEEELTELSLEELLTVEVTSVAKKRQRVEDAPAAVFVISSDDIRRSGATRITDLFRMVPGMQVGENDSNSVAVSARGFNERFSNKLLVLLDGRAIYRTAFSGVYWDQVLVPLEEIERIELVRGPGATLWGANAVNGVINVITKHPIDTQGTAISLGVGTNDLGRVYGRWGGLVGDDGAYRFYVRGAAREGLVNEAGGQINEDARSVQAGFRVDWEPTEHDAFTFQGDVQRGDHESITGDIEGFEQRLGEVNSTDDFYGFNALGRWSHTGASSGDYSVQAFVDFTERDEFGSSSDSLISGLEFQHTLPQMGRHEIVWGANLQITADTIDGGIIQVGEGTELNTLAGFFVQDEIDLIPEELSLTLGTKVERNSFTGFEIQPSARMFWRPHSDFAVWGAVSRAVRTPALFEEELSINPPAIPPGVPPNDGPFPLNISVQGTEGLDSEELYAFELGTRFSLSDDISIDIAAYYNLYDNLIVQDRLAPSFGPTGITQTIVFANAGEVRSVGVEVGAEWSVNDWWTLKGAYTYQNLDFREDGSAIDATARFEGLTPSHQGSLRSQFDITEDIEFDLWLRGQTNLSNADTEGYFDFDARLAWRPVAGIELAITGRNLGQSRREDFVDPTYPAPPGQVERSVFATFEYRF